MEETQRHDELHEAALMEKVEGLIAGELRRTARETAEGKSALDGAS